MIIVLYKDCTLGITEEFEDNQQENTEGFEDDATVKEVTIYGFRNIDGEYFIKQTVFSESVNQNDLLDELLCYVDEMLNDYSKRPVRVVCSKVDGKIVEETDFLEEVSEA